MQRNILVKHFPTYLMQFVETDMGSKVGSKFISLMDGYVSMEMVVKGNEIFSLKKSVILVII